MEIKLIIPQDFHTANENAAPPLQFEPFYNLGDIDFIHLKRGDSLSIIPEADLYGISAYTSDFRMANIIASYLRSRDGTSRIAIGGSHASYRPQEIPYIYDYVVVGNGEDFIRNALQGKLPKERVITGGERITTFHPDSYKHFAPYNPNYHRGSTSSYTLRTSFGCYWNCHFCACLLNRQVLFREASEVKKQVDFLYDKGVRNLRIIDEIFTEHPEFETLCEYFRPFSWVAQTRMNLLTEPKARQMKECGCDIVQVGVESFNEDVRRKLNKRLSQKQLWESAKIAHDAGLKLNGYIMLGTPYDTIETIQETVDIGKNLLNSFQLRPDIFCPLPGTDIGDNPEKHNFRILTTDYEYYSTICFQNIHGRLVGVPEHIKDIDAYEKVLRGALYELNTPIIKKVLDNPITDWYDMYL